MIPTLVFLVLLAGDGPARDDTPRKPSPFAPSLPELTEEEEARLDAVIDRFILYDIGKLKGNDAKQALSNFQKLGPEAIPALIRGLNKAAAFEHSCPAVVIGRKLSRFLAATNDVELLEFARENMGAGVVASRHMGLIRDLRVATILRKRVVLDTGTAFRAEPGLRDIRSLTVRELAEAAGSERGPRLRAVVTELGRRPGDAALSALGAAAASYDRDIQKLARDLLAKHLERLEGPALKEKLKDDKAEIRMAAARAIGTKGLRLGSELIERIEDEEDSVRQAARAALVRLSRGQDFGPAPAADPVARAAAVRQWQAWWDQQGRR
jgi:hypothetical protein